MTAVHDGSSELSAEARRRWRARLPARGVPVVYFTFAHLCLLLAFGTVAIDPWSIGGFFYHPRMLAVVHLITLGWITCSILGAFYVVAPLVLGTRLPVARADRWGCASTLAGIAGMVAHFWVEEVSGMAWSGGLVLVGIAWPVLRHARRFVGGRLPPAVAVALGLAFFNLFLAGSVGVALGLDKMWPFLPGHVHARVFAHAHLAAVGWATLTFVAVGDRLLPMLLPAARPPARWSWVSTTAIEVGVLGLFVGLWVGSRWTVFFAGAVAFGLVLFLARVGWMLGHRRPPPKARPRPDFLLVQVALSLGCLVLSMALGLAIAVSRDAAWELRAILVYGALGLVGFLAQLIAAIGPRLLVWLTWLWASAEQSFRAEVPSPFALSSRLLRGLVVVLWAIGVPSLAHALATDHFALLRLAGFWLFTATSIQAIDAVRVLRHGFGAKRGRS